MDKELLPIKIKSGTIVDCSGETMQILDSFTLWVNADIDGDRIVIRKIENGIERIINSLVNIHSLLKHVEIDPNVRDTLKFYMNQIEACAKNEKVGVRV